MITRKRITYWERQAALIWQQLLGRDFLSCEHKPIEVIYPGQSSRDGPDFRDAVILSKSHVLKGDVEVHVRSSDWYRHGHHIDAKYNDVILHVVLWHDRDSVTLLRSGRSVPVLCLAEVLRQQPYLLPHQLPCSQILNRLDENILRRLLGIAGEQRFELKAKRFQSKISHLAPICNGREEAGQVFFQGLMRVLGYTENTGAFEELANRVPFAYLESQEGLAIKQALLLGTAGLLPSQRRLKIPPGGEEVQQLEQIWQSVGSKSQTMKVDDWHLSHIYPNNSPVRRIVALTHLLERYPKSKLVTEMLRLVKQAPVNHAHRVLEDTLTVASEGYWRDHFDFGARSERKIPTLLGRSKADEIIVNLVLPFAFSWGESRGDMNLKQKAAELYRSYPKLPDNCLTRHMCNQLGLKGCVRLIASEQQGLIHIFGHYCREGRCQECPLSNGQVKP